MARVSVRAAARDALKQDEKARKAWAPMLPDGSGVGAPTVDSFVNFAHKLGVGADNPLSTASYSINPVTRQRTVLEWLHRGSWLGGVAVDVVADDMTRMGVQFESEMPPEQSERIEHVAQRLAVWKGANECIKWGRLYGGCVAVMLIDGQDLRTPFNLETVGPGMFKGLLVLDRWMLEPTTEDLVTELGPQLGMPKYYRVNAGAPALRGAAIHYSRLAFRTVGIELPYQQRLTENLWGISVLERLWDKLIAYDSASTGAAQLVYKSYLRTLSVEGLREIASSGGPAMEGLVRMMELMRRYQGIEGITLIDAKDTFEAQVHGAFSGLDSVLMQFAQQLSGALQIPLTRLFGQSPGGLNATGDNDMRNYYDHIKQRQERDLHDGMTRVYKCIASDQGIKLPPNFAIGFKSLWQLTAKDKSDIAKTNTDTIIAALDAGGLISPQTALKELRQSSRETGVWSNITALDIAMADAEVAAPEPEMPIDPETGLPMAPPAGAPGEEDGDDEGGEVRPGGEKEPVAPGPKGGNDLPPPAAVRRPTSRGNLPGPVK